MIKFCTDGAILNSTRNAVQATVKIIDVDIDGKPLRYTQLPQHLQKEICVYYFLGNTQCLNKVCQRILFHTTDVYNYVQTIVQYRIVIRDLLITY